MKKKREVLEYSRKSKRWVGDSSGQWSWWVRRCDTRERREGRGFGGDPRPAGRTSRSLLWVEGSRTGLGASRTNPLPRPVLGWESPGGGSVGPTVNPEALAPASRCPLARVLVAGPLMEGARVRAASSKPAAAARSRGTRPCAHVCGTAPPRRTRAAHRRKVSRRTTATTAAGSRAAWPARLEQQSLFHGSDIITRFSMKHVWGTRFEPVSFLRGFPDRPFPALLSLMKKRERH